MYVVNLVDLIVTLLLADDSRFKSAVSTFTSPGAFCAYLSEYFPELEPMHGIKLHATITAVVKKAVNFLIRYHPEIKIYYISPTVPIEYPLSFLVHFIGLNIVYKNNHSPAPPGNGC